MNFDELYSEYVGHGRYQWFLSFLLTFAGIAIAFPTLAVVFIGGTGQNYICQGPKEQQTEENVTFSVAFRNNSGFNLTETADRCNYNEVLNSSISLLGNASYIGNSSHGSSKTRKCESWIYENDGRFYTSLKTQYGLTCEKEWLIAFVQTVFMCGWLVGNFVFGSLSDRFGRMTVLPIVYLLSAVAGLAVPFVPNYYGALVLRFLHGAFVGGSDLVRFVCCLELCGNKWRTIIGLFNNNGFNAGLVVLAWLAYGLEPVNHITLQIIIGCVPIIFVSLRWIVPESPRWLAGQGRIEEATLVMKRIARLNGRPIKDDAILFDDERFSHVLQDLGENDSEDDMYSHQHQQNEKKKYNALDLVRTPNLRRVSFAVFVIWFISAAIYYGFLFLNKDLGANVYINTTISGATGVAACFLCIPLINFFGRRSTLVVVLLIMTLSLVISIFLTDNQEYDTALVAVVAIGKFCNILVFDAIYLQTAELFPTCIRSMGVGMGSLMARVGALLAPLASNLVPIWSKLPMVVFVALALIGTVAELMLPETLGRPLPETIKDGEEFSKFSLHGFCQPCTKKAKRNTLLHRNGSCNVKNEKPEC